MGFEKEVGTSSKTLLFSIDYIPYWINKLLSDFSN